MAGEGFKYVGLQPSQQAWNTGMVAIQMEFSKRESVKKAKWDAEHRLNVAASFKGIKRPEDLNATTEKLYGKAYDLVANQITDLNLAKKAGMRGEEGGITDEEYYGRLRRLQEAPALLGNLTKSYTVTEKGFSDGDDVLNSHALNAFREGNYIDGTTVELTEEGYLNIKFPEHNSKGEMTGYRTQGLAEMVGAMGSFEPVAKVSNISEGAVKFGNTFKTSTTQLDGEDGMRRVTSGLYSGKDKVRFDAMFEEAYGVDSPYVQKQARVNHPEYKGSNENIPEAFIAEAQGEIYNMAWNAVGGKFSKTKTPGSSDTKTEKEKDLETLVGTVEDNLAKALNSQAVSLGYFLGDANSPFKHNGASYDKFSIDSKGNLILGSSNHNRTTQIDSENVVKTLLEARNNNEAVKTKVSMDNISLDRVANLRGATEDVTFEDTSKADFTTSINTIIKEGGDNTALETAMSKAMGIPTKELEISKPWLNFIGDYKVVVNGETYDFNKKADIGRLYDAIESVARTQYVKAKSDEARTGGGKKPTPINTTSGFTAVTPDGVRKPISKKFYDSLTDEQKKQLDVQKAE